MTVELFLVLVLLAAFCAAVGDPDDVASDDPGEHGWDG